MSELLSRWWPILPSAAVLRQTAFERCGGFNEEFVNPGFEDPFLWILMREQGEFTYIPAKLVIYQTTSAVERMEKYWPGFETFSRLVRCRYGTQGDPLIDSMSSAYFGAWSHRGLIALKNRDRKAARVLFARARRCDRFHMRNNLRWLRTFLPIELALAVSGGFVRGKERKRVRKDNQAPLKNTGEQYVSGNSFDGFSKVDNSASGFMSDERISE
jgi:hypothetical protein